jgi:hypothetical protein
VPAWPFGIELASDTRIHQASLPVHRQGPILYDGKEITSIYLHDLIEYFFCNFDSWKPERISRQGFPYSYNVQF